MFSDRGLRSLVIKIGGFYFIWLLVILTMGTLIESMALADDYKKPAENGNIAKSAIRANTTIPPQKSSKKRNILSQDKYLGVWERLAMCESGGDWGINTGNGYYGGLQFKLSSWQIAGGSGLPHHASKSEQIFRAQKLKDIQGWEAWPECSSKLSLR